MSIDGILEVVHNSLTILEHLKLSGNLISQVADVTEKLGKLQSAMKRLKEVPNNTKECYE